MVVIPNYDAVDGSLPPPPPPPHRDRQTLCLLFFFLVGLYFNLSTAVVEALTSLFFSGIVFFSSSSHLVRHNVSLKSLSA